MRALQDGTGARSRGGGFTASGADPDTRRRVLWGVGLMAGGALATVVAAALATVLGCSPNASVAPGPIAATPAPATLPAGPPPPEGGLPMPPLALDWRPPSAAAGDVEALGAALARHPRVGLLVGSGSGSELDAMRLAALVAQLAPDTAVHPLEPGLGSTKAARAAPRLAEVLREDPPLVPLIGADGRTQWQLPEALELDAARTRAWAEQGDPAVLLAAAVGVETPVWRELASAAVGSCDPLLGALLDGQRDSLALLEPFLDHADAVLASLYLGELAAVVPELRAELEPFAAERTRTDFDAEGWARHQCGRRYWQYLQPFATCVEAGAQPGTCASTPRLFLRGAARIGSVVPSDYIPNDCPRLLGRDYVEALRAPARAAAELAGDHLDVHWMILTERLATLSEVHGALEQLCKPARRRFAPAELDSLRARVAELGPLFGRAEEPAHDARFLANDGSFHVPGLGKVRQLARYDGGTGSASRALIKAARELATFEREHARCVARPGDPPLMLMLIATASATPEFLGFYYAEELWCGELGPL